MTEIDDIIAERSKNDPKFAALIQQGNFNMDAAVAVSNLRESMGLSQRKFAKLVGKPQSTISRIETGDMNVSVKLLSQIASAAGKSLQVGFV